MGQFALLFLIGLGNFSVGVGIAVFFGKAPRDLSFLLRLADALRNFRPPGRRAGIEPSLIHASNHRPQADATSAHAACHEADTHHLATTAQAEGIGAVSSEMAPADHVANGAPTDRTRDRDNENPSQGDDVPGDVRQAADPDPVQYGLEEVLIDMAAQELHLRNTAQSAESRQDDELDWDATLADVTADIEKLLTHFNEARFLVEQGREVAPQAAQECLDLLDGLWNAINQESLQLLVIPSLNETAGTSRRQLAENCDGVLAACYETRRSCAAYLAHASLERPLVEK